MFQSNTWILREPAHRGRAAQPRDPARNGRPGRAEQPQEASGGGGPHDGLREDARQRRCLQTEGRDGQGAPGAGAGRPGTAGGRHRGGPAEAGGPDFSGRDRGQDRGGPKELRGDGAGVPRPGAPLQRRGARAGCPHGGAPALPCPEDRSNISLSDSSRDLEQARQAIRQASYEAEAVRDLGTSETQRQIEAAEADIKRLDAERELETIELQMGLRDTIEAGEPSEDVTAKQPAEEAQVEQPGEGEEESRG